MFKTLLTVTLILTFCVLLTAQTGHPVTSAAQDAMSVPCSDCHVCDNPTPENPCLNRCPRHDWKITSEHRPGEGPDVVIMDRIDGEYSPVEFSHLAHSHMSEMGEVCTECHHYSPPGDIPPCIDCHSISGVNPKNLRQPGLKGAYHRQCMNCHLKWSMDTECTVCHTLKGSEETAVPAESADAGISEPKKTVYQTEMDEGPIVTFHHIEHTQLYGLECIECHSGGDCGTCHTPPEKRTTAKETSGDPHDKCFACHEDDDCGKCHQQKETEGFTHDKTSWALNKYHQKLSCSACHGAKIKKLSRSCTACHKNWSSENFNHGSITGVTLGEIHISLDCSDCHLNKRFDKKPSCDNCHEGYSFPDVEPEF